MNSFSISQLSRLSGIKAHTIRIWEQRYEALNPGRSEGNTRYYNNNQLRRLLNIVSLLKANYKVSEISSLPDNKLNKLVEDLPRNGLKKEMSEYFVLQLISAGMNLDEINFDKIFSHCLLKYGIRNAYIEIIYPLLKRLGILWTTDFLPPAAEHFISNLIRQKLIMVIDALPSPKEKTESWLLFLPEDEYHEIGLLFSNFLLRQRGFKTIYLGASVPLQSVKEAMKAGNYDNLFLFLTHNESKETMQAYINRLSKEFKNKKIKIAGSLHLFENLKINKNIAYVYSVENLEQILSFESV